MSHEDQSLICKDCNQTFIFSAQKSKEFEEKGYENLPVRCDRCKGRKVRILRKRQEGRRTAYTKPVPPPTSVVVDGKTFNRGGIIVFNGVPRNPRNERKNFGFIEYDGGQIYFPLEAYSAGADAVTIGTNVDFICEKDENGRIQGKTVCPSLTQDKVPTLVVEKKPLVNTRRPVTGERRNRRRGSGDNTRESDANNDNTERDLVDIIISCSGHDDITVHKPRKGANFRVFRNIICSTYGRGFDRKFQLYLGDEVLNLKTFNSLETGTTIEVRHGNPNN